MVRNRRIRKIESIVSYQIPNTILKHRLLAKVVKLQDVSMLS